MVDSKKVSDNLEKSDRSESSGKKAGRAGAERENDESIDEFEILTPSQTLRLIPIRNAVLFPHNIQPVTAGNELSTDSLEAIVRKGGKVGVVTVSNSEAENPKPDDFYFVGTEAKILKIIRLPDNTMTAVVHGTRRFKVLRFIDKNPKNIVAEVRYFTEQLDVTKLENAALGRTLKQLIQRAIQLSPNIPSEAGIFVENISDPVYLADVVVPYLSIENSERQALLAEENVEKRLREVQVYLTREIEILEISKKIHTEVRSEVSKQQRKYYVREQMKQLQKELGELDGRSPQSSSNDPQDLREKINSSKMSQEAKTVALSEIDRMALMQPGSPEYTVSHTYISWLLDVPWEVYTQKAIDIKAARAVLESDHYGLEKIKKRILEFLAVYAVKQELKGPILLFVGPPGVGKTSLGKSIAKALGRNFYRIALGGVRDEAEIRGHRRTYIGSMPGKFADALKRSGSMDPVILLDEVDKIAQDFRGDPASALLEVLDSEQNHAFVDHYLNVPLDLSRILFIATANSLETIPAPLRDRMETIELSGYTLQEKREIAYKHLLQQVIVDHGLNKYINLNFPQNVMEKLIHNYTREAGVRNLRRELAGIARGLAAELVEQKNGLPTKKIRKKMDDHEVQKYLGNPRFLETKRPKTLPVGVSTGLAYTPVGGDVLYIETSKIEGGSGKFNITGQLGSVMKESVQTALAYVMSHAQDYQSTAKAMRELDLHIHFPAGAVKKDGPSAGVAVYLALVSLITDKPLRSDLAVTGEISLRGEVLPVGGIKEKVLAASRYGVKEVILPHENQRDIDEIPKEVFKNLKVTFVSKLQDALSIAYGSVRSDKTSRRKS